MTSSSKVSESPKSTNFQNQQQCKPHLSRKCFLPT